MLGSTEQQAAGAGERLLDMEGEFKKANLAPPLRGRPCPIDLERLVW